MTIHPPNFIDVRRRYNKDGLQVINVTEGCASELTILFAVALRLSGYTDVQITDSFEVVTKLMNDDEIVLAPEGKVRTIRRSLNRRLKQRAKYARKNG